MSMLFKRFKDWARSITAFREGDVIPVDGPSGTAKMPKDDLLLETAQNALAGNVALSFVENSTTTIAGYPYIWNGNLYLAKENYNGLWNASKFKRIPLSEILTDKRYFLSLIADILPKEGIIPSTLTSGVIDVSTGEIVADGGSYAQEINVSGFSYARFFASSYNTRGFAFLDSSNNLVESAVTDEQGYIIVNVPQGASKLRICWRTTDNNSQDITLYKNEDVTRYYDFAERIKSDYASYTFKGEVDSTGLTDIDGTIDTTSSSNYYQEIDLDGVSFIKFKTSTYGTASRGWTIKDANGDVIKFGRFDGNDAFVVVPTSAKKLVTSWRNSLSQVFTVYKNFNLSIDDKFIFNEQFTRKLFERAFIPSIIFSSHDTGRVNTVSGSIVSSNDSYAQEIDVSSLAAIRFYGSSYSDNFGYALLDSNDKVILSRVTDGNYISLLIPANATKLRFCWKISDNSKQLITSFPSDTLSDYCEYAKRLQSDYDVTIKSSLTNVGATDIDGRIDAVATTSYYQDVSVVGVSFVKFHTSSYEAMNRGWSIRDADDNILKCGHTGSTGEIIVTVPVDGVYLRTCWRQNEEQTFYLFKKPTIAIESKISGIVGEYNAEVLGAMDKVANYNNVADKLLNIAFITDTHCNDYDKNDAMVNNFVSVARSIVIDAAIHGGDVVTATDKTSLEYIRDLVSAEKKFDGLHNYMQVYGNHESGYQFASGSVTRELIYSICNNQLKEVTPEGNFKGYFYTDFELAKVRVIVVNAFEDPTIGNVNLSETQLSWIEDTALDVPAGYKVIMFGHDYDRGHTTRLNQIIQSFISGGGTFVAYIHGHSHLDSYSDSDGFNVIGVIQGFSQAGVKSAGCSIFTITASSLKETRIGAGSDRSFDY